MKKLSLILTFICAIALLSSCTSEITTPTNPDQAQNSAKQPLASLSMQADLSAPQPADKPSSRAVFSTNAKGFPTLKYLAKGQKTLPVLCIFRSTDASQPITKVVINWTVTGEKTLMLEATQQFEMSAGTDFTKGDWYMMAIIGGSVQKNSQNVIEKVHYDRFMKEATPGEDIEANIPYITGWHLLKGWSKTHFQGTDKVSFKPLGTFLWMNVKNGTTKTPFMYDGVRMISSSPAAGSLIVSDDAIKKMTLKDVDNKLSSADPYFASLLTFQGDESGVQRRGVSGYATNYAQNKTSRLYYNDLKFEEGDRTLTPGQTDQRYICVWVMPQAQTVSVYNTNEDGESKGGGGELRSVWKTQFLLHSKPVDDTKAALNMLPAFGTMQALTSGKVNEAFTGEAIVNLLPLQFLAPHDNFDPDNASYTAVNAPTTETTLYNHKQLSEEKAKLSNNYFIPGRTFWNAIQGPYGYCYNGNTGIGWTFMGFMQNVSFGKGKYCYLNYMSAAKNIPSKLAGKVAYGLLMAKPNQYIETPAPGKLYLGAHVKQPSTKVSIYRFGGNDGYDYPIATSNQYQHAIRAEVFDEGTTNGRIVLQDRYLGPRFVLDIVDISDEMFWETGRTTTTPDIRRSFPFRGIWILDPQTPSNYIYKELQSAQYWIDEVVPASYNYSSYRISPLFKDTYFAVSFHGDFNTLGGYYNLIPHAGTNGNTSSGEGQNAAVRLARKQHYEH